MARGDYSGRVRADTSDEVGELARAFNRMAAELATRRPPAARAGGQRQPRAAHAAGRALRRAREPRRRRRRPTRSTSAGAGPGRADRPPWSPTCSTSPGWTRAWHRCGSAAVAGRSPGRRGGGRPRADRPRGAVRRRRPRRRSRSRPTRPGCASCSPTCSTTRSGTAPPAAGPGHARRSTATGGGWRSPTRGRASPPPTGSASSSGSGRSPTPTRGGRRHRPGPRHRPLGGDLHGGAIRFVDPPAGTSGARLRVDLPLRPARRPPPAVPEPRSPPCRPSPPRPAPPAPPPPPTPATRARRSSRPRSWTRCSAGSGRTCRAGSRAVVLAAAGGRAAGRAGAADHSAGLGPVPRGRARPGYGGVRRTTPARPVHPDLPGARGAVHAPGAAARRAVDRGAVPAGRRRALIAGVVRAQPDPGVRAGRARLAARRAAGAAVARRILRAPDRPRHARRGVLRTASGRCSGCSSSALLFASADAIFAEWVDAVLPDLSSTRSCCAPSSPSRSAAPSSPRRTSP